ncbi:MAG: glycosyltransferase [Planctomycetota bacterium]
MSWYGYTAILMLVVQLFFLLQMLRNYRYAIKKYKKVRSTFYPKTALIIPCKGLDAAFEKNLSSFFLQDYKPFTLLLVVENSSDPAYEVLCKLQKKYTGQCKAAEVKVLVAGEALKSSQKVYNLLYAYKQIPDDTEVAAFADSDVCVGRDWLCQLVYPLRKERHGVASGYRWFVPQRNNLATLALSAINAKVAQLLGPNIFGLAWGGSMAIRVETCQRINLEKLWCSSISDDLSVSYAVKKAGLKIIFVPACLVASYVSTTWRDFFEFARRQFVITRVVIPRTWCIGLESSLYSVFGLWGMGAIAIGGWLKGSQEWGLPAVVSLVFFGGHVWRSSLRQIMIARILKDDVRRMRWAAAADILGSWLFSLVLLFIILSSAASRTISWRGIRYRLVSSTETVIEQR